MSVRVYELTTMYDCRKSFYGKAQVIVEEQNGVESKQLKSYDTIVAEISDGLPQAFGTYSNTTLRHIKEFFRQEGFGIYTKKQIEDLIY